MITSRCAARTLKFLLAASFIFVSSSAQAAEDTKLEEIVRNAKVIKSAFPLMVERTGPNEATVTTLLDPQAKPNDCKIDAMLVARSLIESDRRIEKVLYHLKKSMSDPGFDSILVRVSDVTAFGKKEISEQQLLTELDVVQNPTKPPAPPPSPPTKAAIAPRASKLPQPFVFHKSGDRDYAVKTVFGHRELALAWLCSSADYLDKMQQRGQPATESEGVFAKMENYLKANDFPSAHRQGGLFEAALSIESRKGSRASASRSTDFHQLHKHYYAMLRRDLGGETPPDGSYLVERSKPIIRIKELEAKNVNTQSLRHIYDTAIEAYNRKDDTGMMAKFIELSNLFSSKYKEL